MTRFLLPLVLVLSTLSSFAAGRELAPRQLAPTVYWTHLPATAFAGDRFLTVWFENRQPGSAIMGAFSDAEGRRITAEPFPIVQTPSNHVLQLLGTGDSYAMFWIDGAGRMQMANLDLDGRITRQVTLPLPVHISARMAWNGTHFLGAMTLPSGLNRKTEAVIFDRDGRIVRSGVALDDQAYLFATAPARDVFTVVTAGWDGLFAQRVSASGENVITTIELSQGTSATAYRPRSAVAIAKDNGDVLVVWSASGDGPADLKSVVVSPTGELSRIQVLEAAGVEPFHVMANGGGYTLAVLEANQEEGRSVSSIRLGSDGSFGMRSPAAVNTGFRASAASNDRVMLVTYIASSPGTSRVTSVAVKATGSAAAPEILAISRARQFQPILGAGGGAFLAVWPQQTGDDTHILTATVNALGEPSNVRTLQQRAFLGSTDLAWNGTEYLALTWSGYWLMARRLTFDGTPIDAEPIVIATNVGPAWWRPPAAATWAGDRWVVVYPANNAMMFASISRSGVAAEPRKVSIDTPLPPESLRRIHERPAIAFDGQRLLLVWSQGGIPPCFFPACEIPPDEAFAVRLDREGNALDLKPLRLPDDAVGRVSIATSGSEFLVIANGKLRALLMDAGGASLRVTASEALFDGTVAADVVWDGSSYVVAFRYQKNARWHLATKRLNRQAVEIEPMRVISIGPPENSDAPSIAGAPGLGAVLANQETDIASGARAIVYREDELQKTGPRRRAVR